MKASIVSLLGIFMLSISVLSCAETGRLIAKSLPKEEVKCFKLGTAKQVMNSSGQKCNSW